MKIRFSAGHGSGDLYNRGGIYFNEGDENLRFTDLLRDKLSHYKNVDVKEIRNEKGRSTDYSLSARSSYGNGADLFYSSHSNAGGGSGVEVFLSYQSLDYYDFAKKLTRVISNTLNIPNRGVKFRNYNTGVTSTLTYAKHYYNNWYGELRDNKAKCAIIVEHFFHDNKNDSKKYLDNKDILADNIAKLIAEYFNLSKNNNKITKNTGGDNLYYVQTGAFKDRKNAEAQAKELKNKGFDAYIKYGYDTVPKKEDKKILKVGDYVRIRQGAKSYEGVNMASFVYNKPYRVDEIKGSRILLDKGGLFTAFNIKDLIY